MQQAFAEVGLKTDYGGPHANGVTHMVLLGFEDGSYLELIAPQRAYAVEGSDWAKFMAADDGACAWAVAVADVRCEVARLKGSGVKVEGPFPGSRKRPDGAVLEWQTARVGTGTPGATLPFLIQDKTPRGLRAQPSASVKGSGLKGIAMVVLGVRDLDAAISAVSAGVRVVAATAGGTPRVWGQEGAFPRNTGAASGAFGQSFVARRTVGAVR
jgi:hypothetical protein